MLRAYGELLSQLFDTPVGDLGALAVGASVLLDPLRLLR